MRRIEERRSNSTVGERWRLISATDAAPGAWPDKLKGNQMHESATSETSERPGREQQGFVLGLRGVRYQVKDVARAIEFYTQTLGFHLDQEKLPAFAQVSIGDLKLILSGPGASGSRPMPDGQAQAPGGWNRVVLQVADLPSRIETLEKSGVEFRNRMETGPGGRQILLDDPDGNPIELFEPAR